MSATMIKIDKQFFMKVLRFKKWSIRKLGADEEIHRTERTIRRSLEKGEMHKDLLDEIAKKINIDPSFLSGEIYHSCFQSGDEFLTKVALSSLRISEYPYFKKEKDGYFADEYVKRVLMFYDISFAQYEAFPFDQKIKFLHALNDSTSSVLYKFFSEDAYGNKGLPNLGYHSAQIDSYEEDHYFNLYLQELKEKWIQNPPQWKTSDEIKKMSLSQIEALDYDLQNPPSHKEEHDYFYDKYHKK